MVHAPARPQPGAPPLRINLYSDTQTLPTPAMKEAMMRAELGDEQHGSDPTVTLLCDRMAALTGKQAAVFLPSGTMCNVIATLTHCRRGDEVIAHATSHILTNEGGAHAALTGVQILPLTGARGMFPPEAVRAAIRPRSRYSPPQRLLEVEQTANAGGGSVWPLDLLNAVAEVAREAGWATHMDGARLMNACVASGVAPAAMAAAYDSVWLDFTKGLGAPLGAVLCGSAAFVEEAWQWKQRLGGAMRQAGICAAACLHAIDHHVERLAEDHAHARLLAARLARIPGVAVETPETNLVFFDVAATGIATATLLGRLRSAGVSMTAMAGRIRACTHLGITAAMAEEAASLVAAAIAQGP